MPSKSKKQQRFMGMVHAAQKGELKDPSPEVEKAAKSMKKKDAEDFASTKHKGLPEKVKETFVATSLDNFLKESIENPDEELFIDALLTALMNKGLTDQEADFALGELDPDSARDWAREYELNPVSIDPIADQILKYMFGKSNYDLDEVEESYKGEDDDDPGTRIRDKVKVATFRFNKEKGYSEPVEDDE